ncbi:unnamed protein product [Cuscuta epithymum]|uniref:Uncharacterized protein n=1 Tax=Cuscuta epithymum TaxID=186058 RepID=A0AAV0F4N1_9ASTE|nr:unnamed protein product [Cuscuta epithymum]
MRTRSQSRDYPWD